MPQTCTIQGRSVEKVINAAAARGVAEQSLYEAVDLDLSVIMDPDSRIPFAKLVALYEIGAQMTGDENFGLHIGESVTVSTFDLLSYCALNSPTVGAAFARVVRYNSIWTDGNCFRIETADEMSAIVYEYIDQSIGEHRQDSEMTLAMIATLCRHCATPEFGPTSVEFQHAAPADVSMHREVFKCPLNFSAAANRLSFPTAFLSLPLPKADADLCAVLDRHAEDLLAKYPPRDSVIDQVRNALANELCGGDPSLENVAAELHLTSRTLQRKLYELGTSYNDVLDQMRRQLSMRYLRDPRLAICEVAYMLGFSESSSFHRAFKRWTGVTPKEFRNNGR